MKTVAVIQARMGSSRLPAKMTAEIEGQSLLFHIVQRALTLKLADEVVLATSDSPADQDLVSIAEKCGIRAVQGSESNVLERFLLALDGTDAEYVIRICGDAPLFDPEHLDFCVKTLEAQDADLTAWEQKVETAIHGSEVISFRALKWTWDHARSDPLAYEHVTAYAKAHQQRFKVVLLQPEPEMIGHFDLSIDTQEDLDFIREIYRRFYRPPQIVSLRRVVDAIRSGEVSR